MASSSIATNITTSTPGIVTHYVQNRGGFLTAHIIGQVFDLHANFFYNFIFPFYYMNRMRINKTFH
jgi:hypothetical protein